MIRFCSGLLLCLLSANALSAEEAPEVADLLRNGTLEAAEAAHLETHGFVIARKELKQSFSAYIGAKGQAFVTADAVLNAYHVLFEESLRLQEQAGARHLRVVVADLLRKLAKTRAIYKGDRALADAAHDRACFIVGVAAALFDTDMFALPARVRGEVESEIARIRKAEGMHKSALLGPPEPSFEAFDYTAFRPAGFYDRTPELQRYFRAVRWLQLVPFRSDKPEEMLALDMICHSLQDEPGHDFSFSDETDFAKAAFVDRAYAAGGIGLTLGGGILIRRMNGFEDRKDIEVADSFLAELADRFARDFEHVGNSAQAKDRVRQPPVAGEDKNIEARLLSPVALPDQKALRRCLDETAGPPPGGLEVAAWLGHPLAASLLRQSPQQDRLTILRPEKDQAFFDESDGSVVYNYLGALQDLSKVDAQAPAFMKNEAWQRKTLMSIAASWAQYRHAWSLQARLEIHYMGLTTAPEAFVEPVPGFFERMAESCERMADCMARLEADISPADSVVTEIDGIIEMLRRPPEDETLLYSLEERLMVFSMRLGADVVLPWDETKEKRDYKPVIAALEKLRTRISAAEPAVMRVMMKQSSLFRRETAVEWARLAQVCLRLALVAQRQLDGKPHTNRDKAWLGNLGEVLAKTMLYEANSFLTPRDDAPRIARISSDPRDGSVFHAGIGRPRVMYVLYPSQGRKILCRGVVMPYHELSATKTITDSEWIQRFKASSRPAMPEWLSGLVPVNGVELDEKE
jgi:hypothetical protein